jgi:superfamily I DNA/RNA helicase
MPFVLYAPVKDGLHDPSIAKQVTAFLSKLFQDDTSPGLHIEPIKNSVDPKVRTGRVNDMYRAVLFKLVSDSVPHYVFTGVWPHDKAIDVASKAVLKMNPVNGLPELIMASEVDLTPVVELAAPEPVAAVVAEFPFLESSSPELTLVGLTEGLGLDPDVAELALAATSEDQVMELAGKLGGWRGEALLELAVGATIADVRISLGMDMPPAVEDEAVEDEQLVAALRTPTAKMQFAWLEDQEELRRVIEGGDLAAWRVFLHPEQRKYVESSYSGSFRLSGGAGTGKTVVLLHRARMLAKRDPQARILLTTYTRNLADGMKRSLRELDPSLVIADAPGKPGIYVAGVDQAASQVLGAASRDELASAVEAVLGIGGNRATSRTSSAQKAWRDAIDSGGGDLGSELRSPTFFDAEYDSVVLAQRITTLDEYLRVRRPGRGVALGRLQRQAVWEVIRSYRSSAAVAGAVDFGEVCAIAAQLAPSSPIADHVLVDEGQDLTPPRWQFLRAVVPDGQDDLFIAEDSQQRIYGQRVVLGRHGIKIVGRSRRLTLNYRTTAQVLRFATSVLEGEDFVDLDDTATDNTGYRSARSGPVPIRVATGSLTDELDRAAEQVTEWLAAGVTRDGIGILVRDQRMLERVARGLEDRDVRVRQVSKSAATGKDPQLMTMHRAKGMEFTHVLIFGANADLLPAAYLLKDLPEEERADLLQRERSLFYVAATRARDELVVMWEGKPSEFLT